MFDEYEEKKKAEYEKKKKVIIKAGLGAVGAIVLGTLLLSSWTRVTPGYAGVKYSLFTGLKEDVYKEGGHLHSPFVRVYEYPVSTETVNLKRVSKKDNTSLQLNTNDGKSVEMDITYSFRMEEEKLSHIFKRFRRQSADEIADSYIKQEILNVTQNITTKYSVLQVYSQNREEIAKKVKDTLAESLGADGIILEKFTFSDVRPDKATTKVLQQVADAENQREVLIREQKNLEQEANNIAQQKKNEEQQAVADKKIAIINAEKAAETIKIEAKAQAEANTQLAKSVTQTLVDYEIAQKADKIVWPKVYGGGNMLQLPGNFLDEEQAESK